MSDATIPETEDGDAPASADEINRRLARVFLGLAARFVDERIAPEVVATALMGAAVSMAAEVFGEQEAAAWQVRAAEAMALDLN